jgi:hypothetical protein
MKLAESKPFPWRFLNPPFHRRPQCLVLFTKPGAQLEWIAATHDQSFPKGARYGGSFMDSHLMSSCHKDNEVTG